VSKAGGPTDNLHDDPGISLNMFVTDPNSIRYEQRVKAGKATNDGVSLADKAKNLEIGRRSSKCALRTPSLPSRKRSRSGEVSARLEPRVRLAGAAAAIAALASATPTAQQDLTARARAIHERVIALDTHNDIDPQNFTASCNYTMRLTTQVNLPKMKEGGLDASFFIVFVGQQDPRNVPDALSPAGYERAYRAAIAKFDAVHRLTEQIAPHEIELALTAADRAAHRQERQEGRRDRHRERLPDRRGHHARQGVLRPRRPLHVARP
jgi:uncharacterized membrane protein